MCPCLRKLACIGMCAERAPQGVAAAFHTVALVQNDDALGVAHGAQAVGDDEHVAALAPGLHLAITPIFVPRIGALPLSSSMPVRRKHRIQRRRIG